MSIVNETPTLSQIIQTGIDRSLSEVHVALPGSVIKYDRDAQKAEIQPLLQRKSRAGVLFDWPIITNCPILFHRTSVFSMTYELKPGDTGLIVVSERSLDVWLQKDGGIVDPDDQRRFDMTDGVFIPGLFPFSKPAPVEENTLLLRNDVTRWAQHEDGTMAFENLTSGEELIQILHDLIIQLENSLIRTGIGPQPFTPATIAAFDDIKDRLDTLKE